MDVPVCRARHFRSDGGSGGQSFMLVFNSFILLSFTCFVLMQALLSTGFYVFLFEFRAGALVIEVNALLKQKKSRLSLDFGSLLQPDFLL